MSCAYQRLTFVLDEVSSLRHEFRNKQGFFTCVTFVAGTIRQVELALPGRHEITAGMPITVVLREPGDWGALEAWRFDATGKVIMRLPPANALIYLVLLTTAFCIALALLIGERMSHGTTDWPLTIANGRSSLVHDCVHRRRSSLTSWWHMPSRSFGLVQEIKAFAVICISRAALVTAQTFTKPSVWLASCVSITPS